MENKEKLVITKEYSPKEAFIRLVQLYGKITATESKDLDSEYNKLIEFLGLDYIK